MTFLLSKNYLNHPIKSSIPRYCAHWFCLPIFCLCMQTNAWFILWWPYPHVMMRMICFTSWNVQFALITTRTRRKSGGRIVLCWWSVFYVQRKNILYNPSTGDCELLYVDLPDDPCNLYAGDTGTGSIGLKARINVNVLQLTMIVILAKKERRSLYYWWCLILLRCDSFIFNQGMKSIIIMWWDGMQLQWKV